MRTEGGEINKGKWEGTFATGQQVHVGSATCATLGIHDIVSNFEPGVVSFLIVPSRRYGRVGNVHCSENSRLLDDILRKEWGFDGIVMSDW